MLFYDVIYSRKTIRDFTDQPVPQKVIERIIQAGLQAPTNNHLREWEFIINTDREFRAMLLQETPDFSSKQTEEFLARLNLGNELADAMYRTSVPRQHTMLATASCLILPLFKTRTPLLQPEALRSLNGFASIWCCIENILLAATAEGLGSAIRIPAENEQAHIQKITGHPDTYYLPCFIGIGYPQPEAKRAVQVACPIEEKIHVDRW